MDTSSASPASATTYSLSELLGGKLALIIPDMQRDYCWDRGKVAAFIDGILHLYARGRGATLGLLYGYECPPGSQHINIIDGQQRLTTLYLLLGMLFRRSPEPWLRRLLISDYELVDDGEPRLLYQARREALYFMSDLVTRFFLDRDGRLSQLEASDWYYKSYDSDLSVQSFISAIRAIDERLEAAAQSPGWDFARFTRFTASELKFMYCGLDDRVRAEKMFITINTTGEQLTIAQQMRALTIAMERKGLRPAGSTAPIWNEMEQWFWQHRGNQAATLDDLIELWQPAKDKTLDDFYSFFKGYARLAEAIGALPTAYPALPCTAFAMRFPNAEADDISRLWRYLCNIARYQRPSAADAELAMRLAAEMQKPDILSILKLPRNFERLANNEERAKLSFIKANIHQRPQAEEVLARAEEHPLLNGRASKLIEWSNGNIETLREYVGAIYAIWGDDIDKRADLDALRQALLTVRHPDYPIVRRGDTILSLCWNDYDWQRLMLIAPGLVRHIIDRCTSCEKLNPRRTFAEMAQRFSDKNYPYYILVKNPELMPRCRKRQLLRPCEPFLGFYDLETEHTRWMIEQREAKLPPSWAPLRPYGSRCLYTDHKEWDIAIDIHYRPNDKRLFRVEIFNRPDCGREPYNLKELFNSALPNTCAYDKKRNRHFASLSNKNDLLSFLHRIFTAIGNV